MIKKTNKKKSRVGIHDQTNIIRKTVNRKNLNTNTTSTPHTCVEIIPVFRREQMAEKQNHQQGKRVKNGNNWNRHKKDENKWKESDRLQVAGAVKKVLFRTEKRQTDTSERK